MATFFKLILFCALFGISLETNPCDGTEVYAWGVDNSTQKEIVDLHNNLRTMIVKHHLKRQPKGEGLERMKYDTDLAVKAKLVSETCKDDHIEIKDERFSVGQNLYKSRTTGNPDDCKFQNWTHAIEVWFAENKNFKYPSGKINPDGGAIGHYTQVVWANTKLLGCDFICWRDKVDVKKICKLYTCNYGPGGNYRGMRPYNKPGL